VELLTALPLMAIATGCAVLMLAQAAADRRAQVGAHAGARELRHARAVLAAELAPLRARDLITVSDTLLAVRSQQGVAQLCTSDSLSLDIAVPPIGDASAWPDALKAGDAVRTWVAGTAFADTPSEAMAALTGPARRIGGGPCGAATVRQRWRLPVGGLASAGAPLLVGAPVIAQREVQFVHYRSNGRWWLGRRARDGAGWETLQPVAGPLESPARRGLTLRGLNVARTSTTVTDSMAAVVLTLRVPVVARPSSSAAARRVLLPPDSLTAELSLRAEAWSRGGA
jgi:hypothetical protein